VEDKYKAVAIRLNLNIKTMKKQFVLALILSTLLLLFACGKSEKQIRKEKWSVVKQKTEHVKAINKKASINLSRKYNSVTGWDTLECYTYIYQEMFIDQGRLISFEGELKDITKTDSTYYLRIHNIGWYYSQNYIALISLRPQKFLEFQKVLHYNNQTNEGCFVFKVSKILSALPAIKSEFELDVEDSYSYIDYKLAKTLLIFKGDLIDFYLNVTVNTTDE
jgi:hypothetical protein